jgi:hypothetical protein
MQDYDLQSLNSTQIINMKASIDLSGNESDSSSTSSKRRRNESLRNLLRQVQDKQEPKVASVPPNMTADFLEL